MTSVPSDEATATVTAHEVEQIERANATGLQPVVFTMAGGCCPAAGTGGQRCPRSPATPRSPRAGNRAVPLTDEQFRYSFANAVSEEEAKELYETLAVPASGKLLFQAAAANLNPWTEAKVDTDNPDRGPLLIISGEKDHSVPWAMARASYKHQEDNPGVNETVERKGRGHALIIDSGWREVCDTALSFVRRFV